MKLLVNQQGASIIRKVRDFLAQERIDSYLVGGYIRDNLLDHPTRDIDIAVAAAAPEVAQRVASALNARYVLLDEVHEIARVVLTEDDPGPGTRWHVDFSSARAGITENLSHRDFTINAMSANLSELNGVSTISLIDPFNGKLDLEKGIIKTVSDAAFRNDPVRLLRAVRLAAEYGFSIEEHTEELIRSHSDLIPLVAGERIREELCRLLSLQDSARFVHYLDQLGLLTNIVPELIPAKGVEQPIEHYWDVFEHSIETVAALERLLQGVGDREQDPVLSQLPEIPCLDEYFQEEISGGATRAVLAKIAALLHDIAKPQTKSVEPNGRTRFLGHTKEGAVVAGQILQRLRFSTKETKMVQSMVQSHLRLWQMGSEGRPTHRAVYRFFRDTSDVSVDIIMLTLADFLAARGPNLEMDEWKKHCQMMDYIWSEHEKEEARVAPAKLIDGHDLIDVFGLEPGPKVGRLLEEVREAQGIGEIATREEAMAFVHKQLDREGSE